MRGHYYDNFSGRAIRPTDAPTLQPVESAEDKNARENRANRLAGNGPQVIASPDVPASGADIAAIVTAVALTVLLNEIDSTNETELYEYYPQLDGITLEQIRAVIKEGLA